MTSLEFETMAAAMLAAAIAKDYGEQYGIEQIHMVWFAHVLGNKKGIFIDANNRDNHRIYEVTFNSSTQELYIDTYTKTSNMMIELPGKDDA